MPKHSDGKINRGGLSAPAWLSAEPVELTFGQVPKRVRFSEKGSEGLTANSDVSSSWVDAVFDAPTLQPPSLDIANDGPTGRLRWRDSTPDEVEALHQRWLALKLPEMDAIAVISDAQKALTEAYEIFSKQSNLFPALMIETPGRPKRANKRKPEVAVRPASRREPQR